MKDDAGQKKTCHNVIKAIGIAAGAILVIVVLSLVLPCVIAAGETSDSQSGITVQREISPVFAGIDQEVQVRYVISNTGAVDVTSVTIRDYCTNTNEFVSLGDIPVGEKVECTFSVNMGKKNKISECVVMYTANDLKYTEKTRPFVIWNSLSSIEETKNYENKAWEYLKGTKHAYIDYTVSDLGIMFEGPSGWEIDSSVEGTYTLGNPILTENYVAIAEIMVSSLQRDLKEKELVSRLKSYLSEITSGTMFKEVKISNVAGKNFVDGKGYYGMYKGVLEDGREIGGRVIISCANRKLYFLHVSYPITLEDEYAEVFNKIRTTLKRE